jgi:hypothetical protein
MRNMGIAEIDERTHVGRKSARIWSVTAGILAFSLAAGGSVAQARSSSRGVGIGSRNSLGGEARAINLGGQPGSIAGLSVVSPSDAWAVGSAGDQTRTFHWNGTAWQTVASPSPSATYNDLTSVSAVSPTNAWAVGSYATASEQGHTLILHWNGGTWTAVSTPGVTTSALLESVSALSPTDVWAVGFLAVPLLGQPTPSFILHWNGIMWERVRAHTDARYDYLYSVDAISRTNVWAVGSCARGALILHWNGSKWRRFPGPRRLSSRDSLSGVSAESGSDVWAVGRDPSTQYGESLIIHWNGGRWVQVASPQASPLIGNWLNAVDAVSRTDVWAVGARNFNHPRTLIARWNGKVWKRVPSPNPATKGSGYDYLYAVDTASPTRTWVAGSYHVPGGTKTRTLIVRLEHH